MPETAEPAEKPGSPPPSDAPPADTSSSEAPPSRFPPRDRRSLKAWLHELVKFGFVGGLAYVIDAGGFNLLVYGPGHVLADVPVRAKILTGVVATLFAWFGNRYWTFAGKQTDKVWREFAAFVAANLVGVAIAAGCLWVSRWSLDLHSGLADNISGNIVGTGLGTIFRYLCYRYVVFTGNREATAPRHG